jgi:hypothetical protein
MPAAYHVDEFAEMVVAADLGAGLSNLLYCVVKNTLGLHHFG